MITDNVVTNPPNEITVLLVEDDDVDVIGIKRALKKIKILNPVLHARDGLEALTLLRTPRAVQSPYIILLDLNLPRMNGLEFLAELRKDPVLSCAVVFVLSTSKTAEDKLSAYYQHVAGYFVKNRIGSNFQRAIDVLEHYGRVVELPSNT